MRIRVKRSELLKTVEGRIRKAEDDHKRAVEAYPAEVEAWREKQARELEAMAARIRKGHVPTRTYYFADKPIKPSKGKDLCNLERVAKSLRIGADEAISLDPTEADLYFGPCKP